MRTLPNNSPARIYPFLMSVPDASEVLLYGGRKVAKDDSAPAIYDTWTFDGKDWYELDPPTRPEEYSDINLVRDPSTNCVILIASKDEGHTPFETWVWEHGD